MLASRTTGTKQKRKPKQKPKRNPKKRDQKWEPMAHTCAVCETKTTSAGFKRTCFEKHEFVCVRFHKTLLRAGKTGSCSACVQEEEMDKRRIRDLEVARRALEEIAAALEACVKRKRGVSNKLRNAVRRVEELEVEIVKARLTTDEGLRDREAGFLRWRSS
jgi:hypothetical protein